MDTQYKHTKLFYDSPNKNKSKYILKMGTKMLSMWIKCITGHNNLSYFQSKVTPEIDPMCRLCLQSHETLYHLITECEAAAAIQLDILKNKIPLLDITWSVDDINKFIHHPSIHMLLAYDTEYNNREIEYVDHDFSSDASSE